MDPITLIVTALAAGATAGLQDGVKDTVKEGYLRLKEAVRRHLAKTEDGELALEKHEKSPEKWEGMLKEELSASGAGDDTSLLEAARALLELAGGEGAAGKYTVTVSGGQGVQVGDGNTQTNTFG